MISECADKKSLIETTTHHTQRRARTRKETLPALHTPTMRILITLQATANTVYNTNYHHKLRGRIGTALQDTPFSDSHGTDTNTPTSVTMSNIFPWTNDITEGDTYNVLIASPNETALTQIAENLQQNPEFNVGEMGFEVIDQTIVNPDVGEPGTQGVLSTATGVLIRIPERKYDDYGITPDGNPPYRCWEPDYSLNPFITQLENNLDWKHTHFEDEYLPGPTDLDNQLFDEYELLKTYGLNLEVTSGTTVTYIVSKWNLTYTVQNNHHRRHLNLALAAGLGERNGMGLGFVNRRDYDEVYNEHS